MFKRLHKTFKRFIGNITLPEDFCTLEDEEGGTFWTRVYNCSELSEFTHPYVYVEWKQDWLGVWREQTSWLGRNSPLSSYKAPS